MRLALLALVASLSSLPLLAQDDLRVSQSPVTIAASFSRTGVTKDPVDRPDDDDVNVNTPIDSVSYGNAMILRNLLAPPPHKITNITGWSIVAVWADWPGVGNSYKFFARKKGEDPIPFPDSMLKLELTDPYVGKSIRLQNDVIRSGNDQHKSLAQLTLGALGTDEDSRRETKTGTANGVLYGIGTYIRPAGATAAIYRPTKDTFTGYGEIDNGGDGTNDVLTVSVRIGASTAVKASLFTPTPTEPSQDPDATVIVTSTN